MAEKNSTSGFQKRVSRSRTTISPYFNIAADLWYDFEVLVPQKKNGKKKYLEKKRKKNKNKKNKRGRKMWRKKISSVVGLEE